MAGKSLRNWQPDAQQVQLVTIMLLAGVPQETIAQAIIGPKGVGLSVAAFRKAFAGQCVIMAETMNANVVRSVYVMATSGGSARAATFWVGRMDSRRDRAEERAERRQQVLEGKATDILNDQQGKARTLPPRAELEAMSLDELHRLAREKVGAGQSDRA